MCNTRVWCSFFLSIRCHRLAVLQIEYDGGVRAWQFKRTLSSTMFDSKSVLLFFFLLFLMYICVCVVYPWVQVRCLTFIRRRIFIHFENYSQLKIFFLSLSYASALLPLPFFLLSLVQGVKKVAYK